jgi:hypothetical protein
MKKMNSENIDSGERLSFFKLFKEKEFRVVIPIIQRDYAQGRKSKSEIRNNFLDALYTYLDENNPNRDLDFIYGNINKSEDSIDFLPLDGQQRLTTLFLLHWYLYQISDNTSLRIEFKNTLTKDNKSLFTYKTRPSSTDFCNCLLNSEFDMNNLVPSDSSENNSLSKSIKNSPWYFLSWQNDPTIQAMLVMLDSINQKFKKRKDFFVRLMDLEKPIITFLFLNLSEFKLTDDLYIKMNSRGKPLTAFENFKAKLEKHLSSEKENHALYKIDINGEESGIKVNKYFSINIDNKWADLFWNYRGLVDKSSSGKNLFDKELMNFIRVVFSSHYASEIEIALKDFDYPLEYLIGTNRVKKDQNYSDEISFDKYIELGAISKESILFLIDSLNTLVNNKSGIEIKLDSSYRAYFNEENVFKNALTYSFESNHQRICFYAYLRFLITSKDRTKINDWMRLIHNLSHPDNTVIDSAAELAAALKSIDKLLSHSDSIIDYLKSNPSISAFSSWQIQEEIVKGHLISIGTIWKETVELTEKHKYFNGQIAFILEFSGIIDYFLINKNCDWNEEDGNKYLNRFNKYSKIARFLFSESYENRVNDKDYIFERAVLTKGDYLTKASAFRKNILSTNKVGNNIKRDHSWKRLLRLDNGEDWVKRRQYVQEVFDDSRMDENSISDSLIQICNDETDTWRDYLIKNSSLIKISSQGFIRYENDNNILIYKQSQSNFYHVELYTYNLFKTYFEIYKEDFAPFQVKYKDVRSIEDSAGVILDLISDNQQHYIFEITKSIDNQQLNDFNIIFKVTFKDVAQPLENENLKKLLVDNQFNCKKEENIFNKVITRQELESDFSSLIQKIIKLL